MYHDLEVPERCEALWQTCHSLVPDFLKNRSIKSENRLITRNDSIDPQSKSFYLIKSGTIKEKFEGQVVVIHEAGDLVNADGLSHPKATSFETDFSVTVDEYDGQQFIDEISDDKNALVLWSQYLSCMSQSYQLLMCHFSEKDTEFTPEFRNYKNGDVLIEENTEGDEVFTLMSGSAKVVTNNKTVGEINKDEIFGAIAAITNTKRNASIVATSDCVTIVVKKENFRSLLSARPDTVQKLINDMARTVVSCNNKIIELSKS